MKGQTKLTKMNCDLFIAAKDLLNGGYSQASVCTRTGLGRGTILKVAHSDNLSGYCRLVEEERLKKAARKERALKELEKIVSEAKYDRVENDKSKIDGAPIFVLLACLVVFVVVLLIAVIIGGYQ